MKRYKWYKIAESKAELQVEEKYARGIQAGGKDICLTKYNDQLYACASKCPHAGGVMEDGWVDAMGNIVCPLHRYKFSLEKGRNTSGEGYFLKTFPIEERADGVYVGIEVKNIFGF